MINYTYESLFRQDTILKEMQITDNNGITLTNADLHIEEFELIEQLNTDEDLRFGSCIASTIKFTTGDLADSFIGKELVVTITLDNKTQEPFLLGTYRVVEETLTADRTKKEIVAKDSLYQINTSDVVSWYDNLEFPMTLADFRHSFFSYMGIAEETITLANDSMVIERSIVPNQLNGGEVIRAICEINGVFGHITRDNKFRYVTLGIAPVYALTANLYIPPCNYADYVAHSVNKVIIRQEENDVGASVGSGTNELIVQGNFLVYGIGTEDLQTIATNLYSVVSTCVYTPATIDCIGNPCVEVGDLISLTTRDNRTFYTYVLSRTMKGIQALRDSIESQGNEYRETNVNSAQSQWLQLMGKTNTLDRTLEQTVSEVSDLSTAVTSVTQTANDLTIQVQNLQEQIDGETGYYEREGVPTLLNYPYWDFTTSFPCNGTIQLDEIYTDEMQTGGNQYPHFYYSEQDRKDHMRDLCIDLETGDGYRFVLENNVWQWKQIADSDFSILFNQISELRQTVEGLETTVSDTEIEVIDHESRITNNESSISQQATQISAKVNQTDHNQSNTFGWTLNTSGFNVQANGQSVLLVNSSGAEIRGKITAMTGFIGNGVNGFTIGNTSISNGMTSFSDTSHDGIYLGTDGIALGKGNFKVNTAGRIEATSGKIGAWDFDNNGLSFSDQQGASAEISPSTDGGLGGITISSQSLHIGASRTTYITGDWGVNLQVESGNYLQFLAQNTEGTQGYLLMALYGSYYYPESSRAIFYMPIFAPSYEQTSDIKEKENVKDLSEEEAFNLIMSLRPREFTLKKFPDKVHHGFIAQEVKELIPENSAIHGEMVYDEEKTETLSYTELIADLVATVQKQQKEIDELKAILKGEK